jgi:hypothetical protein
MASLIFFEVTKQIGRIIIAMCSSHIVVSLYVRFQPLYFYCYLEGGMKKICLLFALIALAFYCSAQVAVSKEPMHHNVFENVFVRVLDVHVKPGDTTLFHKHETPSVFIVLHSVKTGSEVITEEAKATAFQKDAFITFEGFYKSPRIHRVWNEDTAEFHVMDVEILNKNPLNINDSLQPPFQVLFDEKPVITYRLNIDKDSTILLENKTPILIVGLTDAYQSVTVNNTAFSKKGDFLFVPSGSPVQFTNKNKQHFSFAVLQFK